MDIDFVLEKPREGAAERVASKFETMWPHRYPLLDGLRGVAALTVVLHHVGVVSAGHFAVMVFFVISGYCITASAESFRSRGLTIAEFLRRRVRRIYPPYVVAVLFYVITRTVKAMTGGANELSHSWAVWLQNFTLTQWLTLLGHPQPWPSENPTLFVGAFWSLNYEEQFYLVVALCLVLSVWRRIPMLLTVTILSAAGLALNLARPSNWICGFFLEYWVHFALGSSLFFALCKYPGHRARYLYIAVLLTIGIALGARLLPWSTERIASARAPVEIVFLVGLTLTLLMLRPVSEPLTSSKWWKPFALLGTISYSLYLVHQFNVHMVNSIAALLLPGAPTWLNLVSVLALHIALASAFWYCFERPFLRRKELPRLEDGQPSGRWSRGCRGGWQHRLPQCDSQRTHPCLELRTHDPVAQQKDESDP
jgi:peptidoglycan/LPS O-acetylase OafA/YrhL